MKKHRTPCFCSILPGHVLRHIAKNTTDPATRNAALDSLAIDTSMRMTRATFQLLETGSHHALAAGAPAAEQRTIYDTKNSTGLPGTVVLTEGGDVTAITDVAAKEAYDGLGATFDFYAKVFQRNSIDDEGLHLDATVHYGKKYNNAFWNGSQMVFGDGDGQLFNRFTISLDVIGHELTHGVTGDEAQLVYMGQPGALNESISDVFGSMVKQYAARDANGKSAPQDVNAADWLIGAGLFTANVKGTGGNPAALRSMKDPGSAYDDPVLGKDPQPGHTSKFVHTAEDNGGVHINSGIPNRAFYLVAKELGGYAWEKAGVIWYDTIRDKALRPSSGFRRFAQTTLKQAGHRYGSQSKECDAVLKAWNAVGIELL